MCGRVSIFEGDTTMVYVITHRAKDGSLAQESVVADSRKDALDQMKARGFAVLSCKECSNCMTKQVGRPFSSRYVIWSTLAIVVAVSGILAFIFFWREIGGEAPRPAAKED